MGVIAEFMDVLKAHKYTQTDPSTTCNNLLRELADHMDVDKGTAEEELRTALEKCRGSCKSVELESVRGFILYCESEFRKLSKKVG